MAIRSSLGPVSVYRAEMGHEWLPQTAEELREQASKLRQLAAHIQDRLLHDRLLAEAAALDCNADAKLTSNR